ncbi:MAG: zinc-dependent alcohol dehydrogenase family protein [Steroidobacteraceae bacterium]
MKIKAAVLREIGRKGPYAQTRPLEITELELDPPGRGELLLGMRAVGLCHSDLSVIDGNRPRPVPMVLGHEAAGEVLQVGEGVTQFALGDHVVTTFVPTCGHCSPCMHGRPGLCEPGFMANSAGTLLSGARRLHDTGSVVNHMIGVAGFADHAVVAQESCVRIDRELPFDEAALFGCAIISGVGAVVNTAQVTPGSTVAVVGLGGVGLAAIMGAKRAGAASLLAVDLSEAKLELAGELGATEGFNAGESDVVDRIRAATFGGVDYAFEMAGSAKALELAWRITRRGGMTVTAGLPHADARLSISPTQLTAEERTLKGSYLGSCIPARDIPRYIEWYRRGELPVQRLLSERLALEDINAGFDRLASGAGVRQVIVFG